MEKNYRTVTFKIKGMTCVNCENRIERKLKNKNGIANAIVSYGKGTALVTYDPDLTDIPEIAELIGNLGYEAVIPNETLKPETKRFSSIQVVGIFVILIALYVMINHFGGFNIFNYFPQAKQGMGYGMLFVIGLLTSTHCIAMCGGINLSQCVPYKTSREGKNKISSLMPSILYNSGRVISYTIIGGLVGALGSVVSFTGAGKGIVALIAGVFMVIMGLNMLNLFPWLRRFNPRMPKIFAVKINEQKNSNKPLYVGLLNGLMPCGPLQAMQLYALSTGDPIKGALSMLLFSLGTVPLMFGLGALSTVLTKKFTSRMMSVSAALVVILGVFMFSNGMALTGYAMPFSSGSGSQTASASSAQGATAELVDGVQVVTTKLNSGGYEPIVVQKGIPVQWNIQADASDINGCNNRIVVPEYNLEKQLEPGDNMIEFTPDKSGVVRYSCWMGMIRSQITIVDDLSDPSQIPETDHSINNNLPSCCGA
ncbi:MAG TPA: sulfite exporter TauE/SafE family protein [Anaerovoracaceae bacterium]|nr:sulfite exporter TauE/SafE family protein [Anaerovoracaceae bacterium]